MGVLELLTMLLRTITYFKWLLNPNTQQNKQFSGRLVMPQASIVLPKACASRLVERDKTVVCSVSIQTILIKCL